MTTPDAPGTQEPTPASHFTTIIGIDCATRARKIGLARARWRVGSWILTDAHYGSTAKPPAETAANWIAEDPDCLLALDAPLGWPAAMGRALPPHEAGQPLNAPADRMFDRATDRYVRRTTGKKPLDVGADRIARTAHATLAMLKTIRERSDAPIPLAWSPTPPTSPVAIEVYPAATLVAHGLESRGYKRSDAGAARAAIWTSIEPRLAIEPGLDISGVRHDVLDAVLCIVAGLDFLEAAAAAPEDPELARREGWIWVRDGRRT